MKRRFLKQFTLTNQRQSGVVLENCGIKNDYAALFPNKNPSSYGAVGKFNRQIWKNGSQGYKSNGKIDEFRSRMSKASWCAHWEFSITLYLNICNVSNFYRSQKSDWNIMSGNRSSLLQVPLGSTFVYGENIRLQEHTVCGNRSIIHEPVP